MAPSTEEQKANREEKGRQRKERKRKRKAYTQKDLSEIEGVFYDFEIPG